MSKYIKKPLIFLGAAVVSVILHNLIYGLFEFEEPVFFMLAFIFAFGFVITVIYNLIKYLKTRT